MNRPNPKLFMVLTALSLVVGSGLAYMQYQALTDASSNVQKLRKEAKDEKQVATDLEFSKAALDDTKLKLAHLEQGVSEPAYIPTLLKELEATGKNAGTTVLGVRPIAVQKAVAFKSKKKGDGDIGAEPKKPYTEMNIEVRCRGSYSAVQRLIQEFRMFPKIVAARAVSLQPKAAKAEDRTNAPMLDATIELRSYVFIPPKEKAEEGEGESKGIKISGRNKEVQ